ncbi:histidine phosphatase family protein [Novosphingobium sp. FSW06-99]|uniref:histidine phosphatase family protein n=1 Tax=Novosphingobium sp. FSW06-99 TaxID=1739113 RepID=UPI00076D3860|nr:histidine phosphatase family protein [Novosphingobium sp. FSW06-99]KUR75672.1 phosphoglycerate mutase [Novosphingobium sp. FSW06-99]
MAQAKSTELRLIRHAPALADGRMAGHRDVPADCTDTVALAALRARIGPVARCVTSPAQRCRDTYTALWPDMPAPPSDARLWEQHFGAWEGMPYAAIPDLGALSGEALAQMRPPGGESFADLCARVRPALAALVEGAGPIAVVAHAGTIRAALALALGAPAAGLAFAVAPLSLTCVTHVPGHGWSIGVVNWTV